MLLHNEYMTIPEKEITTLPHTGTGINSREVSILGVRINAMSKHDAIEALTAMISGDRNMVAPVNPEMIIAARNNPAFRDTLNRTSLNLPDGVGVKIAARLYGHTRVERVAGIDTIEYLAQLAANNRFSIFLLGAAPGIAEQAGQQLQKRYPGLQIAGTHAGSPHPDEETEICQRIIASRAEILLVAYGAPKQELWLSRNLHKLPVRIAMCVGGSFDFLAGATSRAPQWMQHLGIEWLYRLIQEPRRWRRMLALPKFAVLVIIERILFIFRPKHS